MSRILLRIMTRKSTIGFGSFKNTTVQNLLNQRAYIKLLSIYYNLELITFDADVLNELHITGNLLILKPGKNKQIFEKYGQDLANQIREVHGLFKHETHSENPMSNYKKRQGYIRMVKGLSKIRNRDRNQGRSGTF